MWLTLILALTFIVRVVGIKYGLPLWLFDDEPPFILAALKMLQLKTLLPFLHLADFKTVLYYPPYLSYLYLVPFSIVIAFKLLFYKGAASLFTSYLLTDLSPFFMVARVINAVLATLSVFFIYKITASIFKNKRAALLASFFVSTSMLHTALSMASRHWLSVFFFTSLVLFFLSHDNLSEKKRYFWAVFSAGLGVGFAIINIFLIILVAFWYLLYEKKPFMSAIKEKYFYGLYALFAALSALPYILYPASLGFQADTTAKVAKTFFGAFTSPIFFAKTIAISEPILIVFAVLGIIYAFKKNHAVFWVVFAYIYTYSIIFYLVFRFEPRFFMGILPFFVILAGYGFYEIQNNISGVILNKAMIIVLLIPLVFTLRLDWLAIKNDSRTLAREWAEKNLSAGSKIMILARLSRLATNKDAVLEQEKIDNASLRKIDWAEADFERNPQRSKTFHALNLFDLNNQNFYENIASYIAKNKYEYLIIQPSYRNSQYFKSVLENNVAIASFGNDISKNSLAESQFLGNPLDLFTISELGPVIKIYKINK